MELLPEIAVNTLYQVRTILIATVNAALQSQSLNGVDVRIADYILVMPLNGVNPAFQIKRVLYRITIVWILNRCIDIICQMIILDDLIENLVCFLCK